MSPDRTEAVASSRDGVDHIVVIAGAGPTGLVLAMELALAGIRPLLVDGRPDAEVTGPRARGVNARTVEILDQRGIAGRFIEQGTVHSVGQFGSFSFDVTGMPTRHPYLLAIPQALIERTLAERVAELGVDVHYGREVVGFDQDGTGVDVAFADGSTVRAAYLVGCDGGRSVVRKTAGIAFTGPDASTSALLVEARLAEALPFGFHRTDHGLYAVSPMDDGLTGLMLTEPTVSTSRTVTLDDVRAILVDVFGSDHGVHDPRWMSRFTDAARQAESYRADRVLIAGDAAHVHSPMGGQGLNCGLQDAVNLGWKLARVLDGTSDPDLLDTYHHERHPVGADTQRLVLAQNGLAGPGPRLDALREILPGLIGMDGPRLALGARTHGLDIRYDIGDGHPLVGRRVPDVDLAVDGRSTTVFAFLRDARPLLLDLTGTAPVTSDRVRTVVASAEPTWDIPVVGAVDAPAAVLVRPDGHVAWAGDPDDPALSTALTTWFEYA